LPLDGEELAQLRAALAPFVREGLSND
jgi:hypothetical protein